MAAFALPELLPNKWRHIGVVIADFTVYIAVIVAPVTARYGYEFGTWEWNFWGIAIFQGLSCLGLLFLYHPPKHPYVNPDSSHNSYSPPHRNGITYFEAFKSLDYLGQSDLSLGSCSLLILKQGPSSSSVVQSPS